MTNLYREVFNTSAGQEVLADLERIVNMTRLDAANPNANAAIYKCAQQALLQRIHNQLNLEDKA